MIELFDEVNEQDQVVGVTNKKDAHENRKLHRISAVFLFNGAKDSMWVQLHKKSELWDHAVGGHLSQGESYDEGARREMIEEIGLETDLTHILTYLSEKEYKQTGTHQNLFHYTGLYSAVAPKDWVFTPNDEVEVLELWPIEKIVDRMKSDPEQFTSGFLANMNQAGMMS